MRVMNPLLSAVGTVTEPLLRALLLHICAMRPSLTSGV